MYITKYLGKTVHAKDLISYFAEFPVQSDISEIEESVFSVLLYSVKNNMLHEVKTFAAYCVLPCKSIQKYRMCPYIELQKTVV